MRRDWIDLNGDVGEGDAAPLAVDDGVLIPLLSSANIACGGHAGDAASMARCVALCLRHAVAIGAHPSFPDREGFGRRPVPIDDAALQRSLSEQVEGLAAIVREAGGTLVHVKPHGALYNLAATDPDVARVVAQVVRGIDRSLQLVGLAGSRLLEAGRAAGLRVRAEGFADRRYAGDGTLLPRGDPRAHVADADEAVAQVLRLLQGVLPAVDGERPGPEIDTICLHGDRPQAAAFAAQLRRRLAEAGIAVRAGPRP